MAEKDDANGIKPGKKTLDDAVIKLGLDPKFGLLRVVSERLYTSRASPIIEYVRNAWDADATYVSVDVGRASVTVRDNGKGMDLSGLVNFLTVGESPRPKSGKTDKGRSYMGYYGVGTIAGLRMGDGLRVTTVKGGNKITYNLNFKEIEAAERVSGIKFPEYKKRPEISGATEPNGTTIEIYGLNDNFKQRRNELLEQLRVEIGKRMPVRREDFKVTLNGKAVEHYIDQYLKDSQEHSIEFPLKDHHGRQQTVRGWFKVAEKAMHSDDSGIYPVVNSEITIRDGHMYDPDDILNFHLLKHRVYGEFDADFLVDMLSANRDTFTDNNHPVLRTIYGQIRRRMVDLAKEVEERKKETIDEAVENVLDTVSTYVSSALRQFKLFADNTSGVDAEKEGSTIGLPQRVYTGRAKPISDAQGEKTEGTEPVEGEPKPRKLRIGRKELNVAGHIFIVRLYNAGEEGPHIELNEQGGEVLVNRDHPMFVKALRGGPPSLEQYVFCSVLRGVVDYKFAVIDGNYDPNQAGKFFGRLLRTIAKY
ncbi:ATP-binding protein [Candidatus Woesearchaeota archaeon]|nr:ATP-binding protein [Candidatus Woesearchaeota archaeon]